jgi:diketogulonate reductase-like aldo/keto reductase
MPFKTIKLNDGREIPAIGFGTWKIPKEVCAGEVEQAIEVGFDHVDTAQGE